MTDVEHLTNNLIGNRILGIICKKYDPEHGNANDVGILLENAIVLVEWTPIMRIEDTEDKWL